MHKFNIGGKINHVQFLPDGERLLIPVGSDSCDTLAIWNPLVDSRHTLIDSSAGFWWRPTRTALPRHGNHLFVAERDTVRRFHLADNQQFAWEVEDWVGHLLVSDDGQRVVVHTLRTLSAFDVDGKLQWEIDDVYSHFEEPPEADLTQLSVDSFEMLAIVGDCIVWRQDAWQSTKLRTINLSDGKVTSGFLPLPSISEATYVNSNGAGLFGVGDSYGIHIMDSENDWNSTKLFIKDHHGSERFAFFGSHSIGVVPQSGHQIHMYDLQSLEKTQTLKWNIGELTCLDFSPVTGMGVAGSQDGRVMLWDMD